MLEVCIPNIIAPQSFNITSYRWLLQAEVVPVTAYVAGDSRFIDVVRPVETSDLWKFQSLMKLPDIMMSLQ